MNTDTRASVPPDFAIDSNTKKHNSFLSHHLPKFRFQTRPPLHAIAQIRGTKLVKKPVSVNQLAANRANAAQSTGPRSPEGKARSALNSRKHGFTASTF